MNILTNIPYNPLDSTHWAIMSIPKSIEQIQLQICWLKEENVHNFVKTNVEITDIFEIYHFGDVDGAVD